MFTNKPLDQLVVTQAFGERPEYYKQFKMEGHNGTDYKTIFDDSPKGRRDVYAVMDGTVDRVGPDGGYGIRVRLAHNDGSQTIYAHLLLARVNLGQKVKSGEILGISNNTDATGKSTGPHLHFGYRPPKVNMNNGYYGWEDPEKLFV